MDFEDIVELFFEELYSADWMNSQNLEMLIGEIYNYNDFIKSDREAFLKVINERVCLTTKEMIYKYSILLLFEISNEIFNDLLECVFSSDELEWDELYFVQGQLGRLIFMHPELDNTKNRIIYWKILEKSYFKLKEKQYFDLNRIPVSERNNNIAIVMCEQILGTLHGPTKTALDRCVKLQDMGKEVLLVNTAELLSSVGKIPFIGAVGANYVAGLINNEVIQWKGHSIQYIQCENIMPNVDIMKTILQVISEYKPGCCVLVGGTSLLAGFVNELVPVLTIGTTQSGNSTTLADFQTVEKSVFDSAREIADGVNKKENHLIQGKFTFALKDQKKKLSRKELGIPEQSFVLVMIGGRLNGEVSHELLCMLNDIVKNNDVTVVTAGGFEKNNSFEEKYPYLDKKIINLGMQDDVLALLEVCDLYVNPIRKGGATSSVEALYKGVPVITLNFGDVAGTVEEKFVCKDLEEMKSVILKYKNDKQFYKQQAEFALEQARICMDTDKEFERILNVYYDRMM